MRSNGFDVQRRVIGGGGANNTFQERRNQHQAGSAPTLQRAVVVDVVFDPTALTDDQLTTLEDNIGNPEVVGLMPYNSIIARVISNEHDLGDPTPFIFFPFFSSHLQLPVKPGEQVFIIYEDYSYKGNALGYWMTRAPAARSSEDLNYTHGDRLFEPTNNPRNLTSTQLSALTSSAPTFQNGAGTPETRTLQQQSDNVNPYDDIINHSAAAAISTFEAIPRQRKRPGDFAIFGSNNAGIIIGKDRTGPVIPASGSAARDVIENAGTVDIVAGLGAPRKPPTASDDPGDGGHNPTAARVITNSRNKLETDKVPFKNQGKKDNAREGDPDFKRDASRAYISMKTRGDKNFGINFGNSEDNENGIFTNTADYYGTALKDIPAGSTGGQPFGVIKSEHIRLIATGKDTDNGPDASGEIRFIKEGKIDGDKDFGMIAMESDGRVMAQGKNVYLQINDPDTGRVLLGCKSDTEADADPMVLYTHLKTTLDNIIDAIGALSTQVGTQFNNVSNALSVPNAAGPFSPVPALILAKAAATAAQTSLTAFKSSQIDTLKSTSADNAQITKIKSKNIFVKKDNQG